MCRLWHLSLLAGFAFTAGDTVQDDMTRAPFAQFDQRAQAGEALNVVFLGGSLTWGAQASDPGMTSWRALISERLQSRYAHAHFRFEDAAIGGTGSQLAAFRLQRDALSRRPDLVFLDFTVNDDPYREPDPHSLAAYESLVRRMVQAGIPVMEVVLPTKKDVLANPPPRPLDLLHEQIAEAYHVPVADVVTAAKNAVAAESASPDRLWDWPTDATHPGDAGYALYADTIWNAYLTAVQSSHFGQVLGAMLHDDAFMTVARFPLASLPHLPRGWEVASPNRTAIAFDFTPSRWLDREVIVRASDSPGNGAESLTFSVKGRQLFLLGEVGPRSGKLDVRIDDVTKTLAADSWSKDGNGRWFQPLAYDLDPSRLHRIEITPRLEAGQEFRLESLCIAGAPAEVEPGRSDHPG